MPLTQNLGFDVIDPMEFAEGYIGLPAYGVLVRSPLVACCAHAAAYARYSPFCTCLQQGSDLAWIPVFNCQVDQPSLESFMPVEYL